MNITKYACARARLQTFNVCSVVTLSRPSSDVIAKAHLGAPERVRAVDARPFPSRARADSAHTYVEVLEETKRCQREQ